MIEEVAQYIRERISEDTHCSENLEQVLETMGRTWGRRAPVQTQFIRMFNYVKAEEFELNLQVVTQAKWIVDEEVKTSKVKVEIHNDSPGTIHVSLKGELFFVHRSKELIMIACERNGFPEPIII
ncbi:hypothetical protein PRIPAC_70385 [Pristionchus pacificus]|uniref:Uncharacterized protein n=1 Tax=Pristionchus pacificus TaxID=54126 RepID=A0A454Y1I4_PRIPA|nr:hypothetical protein PRIPAC_70385 [Pristionchus pacificus]|eukprot:PDM77062.1 hypothetical protein PRIPAC_42457 [Pristionchus pacificus]